MAPHTVVISPFSNSQARVKLPSGLGAALSAAHTSVPMVLEVWAAGMLACACTTMVMPAVFAPVLDEVASWMGA